MLYLKKKVMMIDIVCFLAIIFLFFAFDDVVFSEVFIAVFSAVRKDINVASHTTCDKVMHDRSEGFAKERRLT